MGRTVKPRWGYEDYYDSSDFVRRFESVDAQRVAAFMGVPGREATAAFDRGLIGLLGDFYTSEYVDHGPSWAEVDAALTKTRAAADDLKFCLTNMDRATESWLNETMSQARRKASDRSSVTTNGPQDAWSPSRAYISEMLDTLLDAIDSTELPEDTNRLGRKPDVAMQGFVRQLASFFREHTGRDPLEGFRRDPIKERYVGTIVDVADYTLRQFAPDRPRTNAAIGEQVRRVIGDRSNP